MVYSTENIKATELTRDLRRNANFSKNCLRDNVSLVVGNFDNTISLVGFLNKGLLIAQMHNDKEAGILINNLGAMCHMIGELDSACHNYNNAIVLNPSCSAAYKNRGLARYETGQFKGAFSDLAKALYLTFEKQ